MKNSAIMFAAFALALVASCVPSPDESHTAITPVPDQYKGNVSTIFGNGGALKKDSLGNIIASNIIWKDSLGNSQSINSLRGDIIILNFWATWCPYCIEEIPDLLFVANEFKDDNVKIVGVSIDKTGKPLEDVKDYAALKKMTYQIVLDQYSKSYVDYGGSATSAILPWTFIINRDGYIYKKISGKTNKAELQRIIKEIL